jgi:hypothetical protein
MITPEQVRGIASLLSSVSPAERDALAKRLQAVTVAPSQVRTLPDPRKGQ